MKNTNMSTNQSRVKEKLGNPAGEHKKRHLRESELSKDQINDLRQIKNNSTVNSEDLQNKKDAEYLVKEK